LDQEAGQVVAALDRLDQCLTRKSLYERIRGSMEAAGFTGSIKTIPGAPAKLKSRQRARIKDDS
jgi:hypothetical protein